MHLPYADAWAAQVVVDAMAKRRSGLVFTVLAVDIAGAGVPTFVVRGTQPEKRSGTVKAVDSFP